MVEQLTNQSTLATTHTRMNIGWRSYYVHVGITAADGTLLGSVTQTGSISSMDQGISNAGHAAMVVCCLFLALGLAAELLLILALCRGPAHEKFASANGAVMVLMAVSGYVLSFHTVPVHPLKHRLNRDALFWQIGCCLFGSILSGYILWVSGLGGARFIRITAIGNGHQLDIGQVDRQLCRGLLLLRSNSVLCCSLRAATT